LSARRVVVVGAGFAGLAAAEALAAGGAEVTVFEARDRVGGRVHSRRLANGAVVELGAEFIFPDHEVLRRAANRLGLGLYEKGTLYGDREPRQGPPVTRDELVAAWEALRDPGEGSVAEVLERRVRSAGARAAIAARVAVSTAYELEDQDGATLAEDATGFGDFPSHSVVGGNDRVALALAEPLDVRAESPVGRVEWGASGVDVAGTTADACIIAVPAPAALAIEFDPPLPEWKLNALAGVRYGQAAKLFLPLERAVEPSATLSVPDRFWTWTQHGVAVASSFAGTAAALERLGVGAGPARWAEAVRRLRPDLPYADGEPVLATWPGGAYSARTLSSPLADDALARPVGPVAFAGEHTAGPWHGLMDGALRSGVRAAHEVEQLLAARV
jgi:monoamine oxidase